jgi:protein TonB
MILALKPLALAGATLSLGTHLAVFSLLFADRSYTRDVAVHLVDIEIAAGEATSRQPTAQVDGKSDLRPTAKPPNKKPPEPIVTLLTQPLAAVTDQPFSIEISSASSTHPASIRVEAPPTTKATPRIKLIISPHATDVGGLGNNSDVSATETPAPSNQSFSVDAQVHVGNNKQPRYPHAARKRGYEGQAIINVRIGTRGEVLEAKVFQSSGHQILDTAASKAVTDWRFRPAKRDGRAVIGQIEIPIEFRLR